MSAEENSDALPLNLHEFEAAARPHLPRMVFDYYAGGANDETLLRTTRAAWDDIRLRHRVMRDVSTRSLVCTVLGHRLEWPAMIAPMALQQMAHADGELATARAAHRTATGMVLSTLSNNAVELLREETQQPLWFQLYIQQDRGATAALVERVQRAGCTAIVLTADTPLLGRRERDIRNMFHMPSGLRAPHLHAASTQTLAQPDDASSALAVYVKRKWDASISWRDLEWLRSITTLPILVKGVVRGDDAALALEHGASGVIVSNHGGRQLDASVATPRALPEVAQAMAGRGALLVDGGIRRGSDVVKAIAMGAQAVLLGRPVLWGLALDGEDGVMRVLQLLRDEFDLAMALTGCRDVSEITPDLLG
ncbi:MAG: alpha-hydroxy-acid oxidizing protein [Phycisphaerae bacterium]|nr:alpha-hydroxy-acid oxidizing protein [Gemmatimonadaceae bacterium]